MPKDPAATLVQQIRLAQKELPQRTRAFETVVNLVYEDYRRLAYSIVGNKDDAEQILQDALIRAFHKLVTLKKPEAFHGWFTVILTNVARTFFTREARQRETVERFSHEINTTPEKEEGGESFAKLVASLNIEERTILALKFQKDLEFSEIAEITGLGLSATKMRYYRALDKLQNALIRVP